MVQCICVHCFVITKTQILHTLYNTNLKILNQSFKKLHIYLCFNKARVPFHPVQLYLEYKVILFKYVTQKHKVIFLI